MRRVLSSLLESLISRSSASWKSWTRPNQSIRARPPGMVANAASDIARPYEQRTGEASSLSPAPQACAGCRIEQVHGIRLGTEAEAVARGHRPGERHDHRGVAHRAVQQARGAQLLGEVPGEGE